MSTARLGLTLVALLGLGASVYWWVDAERDRPAAGPAEAAHTPQEPAPPPSVEPPEPADPPPSEVAIPAGGAPAGARDIPTIDVALPPDYEDILAQLGLERDLDEWFATRGRPGDWSLRSNYETLSPDELRRLSDEGDVVARWVLAQALRWDAPLEASALLRDLAEDGALDAMTRMHWLLLGLDRQGERLSQSWSEDRRAAMAQWRETTDLRTEGLAWGLLGEVYHGLPRGAGVAYAWSADGEPPAELAAACRRAAGILQELEGAWAAAGRDAPRIEAAPIVDTIVPDEAFLARCPEKWLPTPGFDGCRPFRLESHEAAELAYACPGG